MTRRQLAAHGRRATRHLARWIARILGAVLTAFGVLGMLTPIPFGLIFFIIGLMFLIPSTPGAATLVQKARARVGMLDRSLYAISRRLPLPYRRILAMTEVERQL